MSKYDRRRVNAPPSYVPLYEGTGASSTASGSGTVATTSQQRPDKRAYAEMRPIFLQTNLVPSASGSSYVEIGDLKLACSVFGPRQVKGRQYSGKAELNVEVKFAPFSSRRRRRPGKTTESAHLSGLLHQALLPSLRLDLLPKASLDIHIMVLQTDGLEESCIAAACIAATTALASAGIEMYGLVVGTVALVPSTAVNVSADKRVLLDPSSADLGLVSGMKTATRVLMCGMPALASVTCLNVSAGSNQQAAKEGQVNVETGAGIEAELLDQALEAANASLVDIHKVVAQALAEDFQRRTALTSSAGQN
ncbi:Exoribonuclease, phosphorolytic domain 1 [Kalmanozyma brasiliensis GHG001]|uniref:Exoribonuclease phosphorolytic domain-containing protein n=1 Tax=Kalmanozyma brasiliensis (strain GHG001) TaxID=1365824 RepID=V5ETY6_KALBG|nr:Exoribonuclease, phosphorolytic domain 1 [Kalmanozyma brasiliensis GHG001]EST08795.1 Exoribonuclease, phosphorolytic domain 1 [Kalmanozyma brasiliensis GHG001]